MATAPEVVRRQHVSGSEGIVFIEVVLKLVHVLPILQYP